jgi:hypothetical protein
VENEVITELKILKFSPGFLYKIPKNPVPAVDPDVTIDAVIIN